MGGGGDVVFCGVSGRWTCARATRHPDGAGLSNLYTRQVGTFRTWCEHFMPLRLMVWHQDRNEIGTVPSNYIKFPQNQRHFGTFTPRTRHTATPTPNLVAPLESPFNSDQLLLVTWGVGAAIQVEHPFIQRRCSTLFSDMGCVGRCN